MNSLLGRFLRYVRIDTRADEAGQATPSSPGQWALARLLAEELTALGLHDVRVGGHAYVTARLEATPGATGPAMAFLAHLDTACEAPGAAQPRVIKDYDGGDIRLDTGLLLSPRQFPALAGQAGKTLIVAGGDTLLGADDKAGIAIIMTALERLCRGGTPHGPVLVAFVPDEEIGHGAELLDLDAFGAAFAYTVDGTGLGTLEWETFNAARAEIGIKGVSIHPGYAKDRMINAILVAQAVLDALPADETPATTSGREGFFHVLHCSGEVDAAHLSILVRDHDARAFAARKARLQAIVDECNRRWSLPDGQPAVVLELRDQYRNMGEYLARVPHVVDTALRAMRDCGLTPQVSPVRGGTDGARLSARGLSCPNLFCGGRNCHGPYEYAVLEDMEQAVRVLIRLAELYAHGVPAA